MKQNFTKYAFNDSVREKQEKNGSRKSYQRMEENDPDQSHISQRETAHIEAMDSFYMSTVSENGWPMCSFEEGQRDFSK